MALAPRTGLALPDSPHARRARLAPPWPKARALLAAMRRRVCSSNNGHTEWNLAVSSARLSMLRQHNNHQHRMLPFFIYFFIYLFIYLFPYLRCLSDR